MDFDEPKRFVAGAEGEPGERTFFLQATQGGRLASVGLEREQLALLADRVIAIIDELERRGLTAIDAGLVDTIDARLVDAVDARSPASPPREEFQVGTLTIAWDEDVDRVVIEARSQSFDGGAGESASMDDDDDEIPDDAPIGPDVLRVHLLPLMAQQFARRAERVVADGRPACPFCGQPLDPLGHLCLRHDGLDRVH